MQQFNFHTHSCYSDGKSSPEELVNEALRLNLKALGISDHSPVPFKNAFAIKNEMTDNYVALLKSLKEKYKDRIHLYSSMEMEYMSCVKVNFDDYKRQHGLDYLIGSVHLIGDDSDNLWFIDGPDPKTYDDGLNRLFGGDIRKGVKAFFEQNNKMITTESFDIIGHFDKIKMHNRNRYFTEDETWYRNLVMETLHLIKQKDLIVEINTRGIYKGRYNGFYPSEWLFKKMKELEVPVIISSDAHHFSEIVSCFDEAENALKAAGYKEVMCYDGNAWNAVAL